MAKHRPMLDTLAAEFGGVWHYLAGRGCWRSDRGVLVWKEAYHAQTSFGNTRRAIGPAKYLLKETAASEPQDVTQRVHPQAFSLEPQAVM